jgi:hypothetical protein
VKEVLQVNIEQNFIQLSKLKFQRKKNNTKSFSIFSGMDVKHGCMPNGFGHILFGKLKGLYDNESDPYYWT